MSRPRISFGIFILLLIAAIAKGDRADVGDECSEEIWDGHIKVVVDSIRKHSEDYTHPEFLKTFENWTSSIHSYYDLEEPIEICSGELGFKCMNKKCVCNNDGAPFVFTNENGQCRGGDGSFCYEKTPEVKGEVKCKYGFKCVIANETLGIGRCVGDPTPNPPVLDSESENTGRSSSKRPILWITFSTTFLTFFTITACPLFSKIHGHNF